jgi:transcriptional regulator with XRE-family HTH domain
MLRERTAMPSTRSVEIGSRLRESRAALRLSLEDVASELGVSKQAVYMWERGRTKLDIYKLGDLCLMYGVSSDYILFGTRMVPEDLRGLFQKAGGGTPAQ